MENQKITAVLVDDDEMVVTALSLLCEKIADVRVVGSESDSRAGLTLIEKLEPTLALVDVMMPHLNGIELTRCLQSKRIPTRIILITGHPEEKLFQQALRAGACGYLLKTSSPEELGIAIRA